MTTTSLDVTTFKALSFDCYGTLIDWEAGISAVLEPWAVEQDLNVNNEQLLLAYADEEAAVNCLDVLVTLGVSLRWPCVLSTASAQRQGGGDRSVRLRRLVVVSVVLALAALLWDPA